MQHSRGFRLETQARIAARHARLFEMIRQQNLATHALRRLHRSEGAPVPGAPPAFLVASLRPQPDRPGS